jgi:hypothetical protein
MSSLEQRLRDVVTRIGTECKSLRTLADTKFDKTGGAITGSVSVSAQLSVTHTVASAMATATPNLGAIEVRGSGSGVSGGGAFLQFHRPGAFASYLGLDQDNVWKVGGWSAGATSYRILHEGIFSPDSKSNLYIDNYFTANNAFARKVNAVLGFENANVNNQVANGGITSRINSGFYEFSAGTIALGYPQNGNYFNVLSVTHSNTALNYALQFASSFFDSEVYVRNTQNNGNTPWDHIWTSRHFNPNDFFRRIGDNGLELGSDTTTYAYVDMHSAPGQDYGVRIDASGGSSASGSSAFGIYASAINFNGQPVWHAGNFNPEDQSPFIMRFGGNQVCLNDTYDPVSLFGRLEITRAQPTNQSFADVRLVRNTRTVYGVADGVSTGLRLDGYIGPNNAHFYQFLSSIRIEGDHGVDDPRVGGTGHGHHVASYFQLWREYDTPSWSMCSELRDKFLNPTTSAIGFELGMFADGADPNNVRYGLDLSYGAATTYRAGDNVITAGIRIAPYFGQSDWVPGNGNPETGQSQNTGRILLKFGVQIAGNVLTGIDLSGMKTVVSNTTMLLPDNGRIKWVNGGEFGMYGSSLVLKMPPGGVLSGGTFNYANGYLSWFVEGIGNIKMPYALA